MCDDVTYSYCFMQWQTIITYVTASLLDSDHAQGDLKQRQNMRSVTATHELGVWNVLQSKQKTIIFIIQLYYHNSSPRVPLYDFFCLPGPKGFEAFIVKNKHGAQKPNKYCSINFTNISFLNNNKANLRDLIAATGLVISNWIQIVNFSARLTVKFDGWPCKTIGHLFYATSSFVHHFVAIGEFKLQLQSGNAQSGSNSTIFRGVRPWNLTNDLAKQ